MSQMQVIMDLIWRQTKDYIKSENEQLELQFKRELAKIKFRGEITPEKVKRHGFELVHHDTVGTYIRKNGVRVTDIFFKPIK